MSYLTTVPASRYSTDLLPMVDPGSCQCGSPACYECRRLQIDITALAIVERERRMCEGMQGFDIEAHAWSQALAYRNRAVNELAWEDVNGELI